MELVSIIIGIAGFLFGTYAYYKNRANKELTVIYSNQLIEGKQKPGVEMLYLGKPISDFIRYEITLFNSGRGELRLADFQDKVSIGFDGLQVVSQTPTFSSDAVNPEYQINEQDIGIAFNSLKRNNHITFEVLTGAHSKDLKPPLVKAALIRGKKLQVHRQVFEKEASDKRYKALVKHLGLIGISTLAGVLLLLAACYNKYQTFFVNNDLGIREQLNTLLSVNSYLWFAVFLVSLVLLFFAYESLKVLSPKFKRYKFEQLIQNKH